MGEVLPRRGLVQKDGHLETRGGVVIPTPTEADYFHALRLPYLPPHERTAENLRIVLRAERSRKVPA